MIVPLFVIRSSRDISTAIVLLADENFSISLLYMRISKICCWADGEKKITSSRVPTLYKNQPFSVFNVRLSFLQCVKPLDWFEKKGVRTFAECIEECNKVCHRSIVK